MTKFEFYDACAVILRTTHTPHIITGLWKKRWGPRTPGNGRFPGHGIIRLFGETVHIALHHPPLTGIFVSKDEALDALKRTCQESWFTDGVDHGYDGSRRQGG